MEIVEKCFLKFGAQSALVRKFQIKSIQRLASLKDSNAELDLELVEASLNTIISSLQDKETIVRWSSAKGIGRTCHHLSTEMTSSVVDLLIDRFNNAEPLESTFVWHGLCLSFGELARRRILPCEFIPRILDCIEHVHFPYIGACIRLQKRKLFSRQ